MLSRTFDKRRNVVPRWRSIEATATNELTSLPRYPEFEPIASKAFAGWVTEWRHDRSLEAAADLMDVGIVSGDRALSIEAARRIISFRDNASRRLYYAAERVLSGADRPVLQTPSTSFLNENAHNLARRISRYRSKIRDAPRDALAHVELARCYSRLAEFEKAAHHIRIALVLAPDNRFVLRASSRFYTLVDDSPSALAALRSTGTIRDDPWIQSAEVAISELFGKGSISAKRALREIRGAKRIDRSRSELALGLATLEHSHGLKTRDVLKFLDAALVDPTENALAQGVWLTDQVGRDFQARFPTVTFAEDAHEAKSLEFDERGELVQSEREGLLWLQDQPFQARAAVQVADLNLVHLRDYDKATQVAEAALRLHPDDWSLMNYAALAAVLSGNLPLADSRIIEFEKMSSTDEIRAFSSAARGMWWFQKGNIVEGRKAYKRAIDHARRAKRPDLVTNAVIYWSERESIAGSVGTADFRRLDDMLQQAIKKVSADNRKYLERAWHSRRQVIEEAVQKTISPTSEDWNQLKLDFEKTLDLTSSNLSVPAVA